MAYLDTPYKRKSAVATSLLMVLLLFIIFTFGLKYFDPPLEYGIAVNFGTSSVGSGDVQPTEPLKSASSQDEEVVEEVAQEEVQETVAEAQPTETTSEKVLTQDSEESIKIKKQEEAKRKADEAERQKKIGSRAN